MNKPLSQAMAWCETLAARMPEGCHPAIQPFVIPPFTAIQLSQLNKRGAGFCQHGRRDFPGPGALIRFMHILRAGQKR